MIGGRSGSTSRVVRSIQHEEATSMKADVEPRGTSGRGLRAVLPLWAMLVMAGGVAWAWMVRQGLDMGNGVGTMGMSFAFFTGMWAVMMAAMMLPPLGPVAATEPAPEGTSSLSLVPGGLSFGAGFLVPWALYGGAVFLAFKGADHLVDSSPAGAKWVGLTILAVAGLYQLSPWKWMALRHCRMPMHRDRTGLGGAFASGALDGSVCVGCCWALMTVFIAMGVMNLPVMAGLAALIFAEKVLPRPRLISTMGGVALLGLAVAAAVHPSLLSGLHTSGMGMGMMGGM
jgi:predicted metal-binding membrane protein